MKPLLPARSVLQIKFGVSEKQRLRYDSTATAQEAAQAMEQERGYDLFGSFTER